MFAPPPPFPFPTPSSKSTPLLRQCVEIQSPIEVIKNIKCPETSATFVDFLVILIISV